MLSFQINNCCFNHRVAGIAVHDGHVLLHRAVHDAYWALPGGRVEAMETAMQALVREMREEIQADVRVGRLVFVVENYFAYADRQHHELGLYFLLNLPDDFPHMDKSQTFSGLEDHGLELVFRWFSLNALTTIGIKPDFLAGALPQLPPYPEHIVVNDELA